MLAVNNWNVSSHELPYTHFIIDNFLDLEFAEQVAADFPSYSDSNLRPYSNYLEIKKLQNYWDRFPSATYKLLTFLNSTDFIENHLEPLVGVSSLQSDPGLNGAGQFLHERGGKLNPHLDYRIHPKLGLERRFSLLLYLTPNWSSDWGADFVFFTKDSDESPLMESKRITTLFNRLLIFDTTQDTWHGVPDPVSCPPGITRNALGVFYLSTPRPNCPQIFKAQYGLLGDDNQNPELVDLVDKRSNPHSCRETYELK